MVSRSDILRWEREKLAKDVTLGDMQDGTDVFASYSDELVGHLADRMAVEDVGRVPVLDHATGKLVGLVARRDLLRVRARVIREERERRRILRL
jgi:CBS domain-containing protein